ncbi:MAG: orotate phosphoribosyltransferase [Dehalococcoidales bacterium]|nr:orotate phosphoribosyltransferase [Dehalococcoidales bacterium]
MTENVEAIFEKVGAVLKGHFLLTSGLHSPVYWEKFRVLQFPRLTEQLCGMIAERFRKDNVQVVAGPTTGGVILAHEVARQLDVQSIYAEKEGNERLFKRGLTIEPGARVLVVDDVLTTGGSIREVLGAVDKIGGKVIGVAVLIDRTEQPPDFGAPFFACHHAATITYQPAICPLCAAKLPLVKPGSSQQPVK